MDLLTSGPGACYLFNESVYPFVQEITYDNMYLNVIVYKAL